MSPSLKTSPFIKPANKDIIVTKRPSNSPQSRLTSGVNKQTEDANYSAPIVEVAATNNSSGDDGAVNSKETIPGEL